MNTNLLHLNHHDLGTEEFSITNPRYNLYQSDDGIREFVIAFETDRAVKRVKELEEVIDPLPNFEATVLIPAHKTEPGPGSRLEQAEGYDYERDEHLSNFYYFSHDSIEALEVEILEAIGHDLRMTVKGKTIVNGSNGNEPDADLLVESVIFRHDGDLERAVC